MAVGLHPACGVFFLKHRLIDLIDHKQGRLHITCIRVYIVSVTVFESLVGVRIDAGVGGGRVGLADSVLVRLSRDVF